ncbi:MAG: GNAT family N-acetyltransferase [Arcobacter sp.]|nr:MAG: GNAT family N-acetyltransferase [Arcobacter sp.]
MQDLIYFRALELDDYKVSIKWRKDESISVQLGGLHYFVSEAYEKKWVEDKIYNAKGTEIVLAICLQATDQYVGNIYLTDIDNINRSAQLHILLGEASLYGKGIGTEAISKILKYGFEERNLHRIYSHVLSYNTASLRTHEKCGFDKEGRLRNAVFKKGKHHDVIVLSKLNN